MPLLIFLSTMLSLFSAEATASSPENAGFHESVQWSIEDCIGRALSENLRIKGQLAETVMLKGELDRFPLRWLPTLQIVIGQDLNWGRSVDMQELQIINDRRSSSTSFAISANIDLPCIAFYTVACRRKTGAVKMSSLSSDEIREEVSVGVLRCYLQLLQAEQIYKKACSAYQEMVERRDRRAVEVESGLLPPGALFEAQAQLESEKATMIKAEGDCRLGYSQLGRYLGLRPGERFRIAPPPDDSLPPPHSISDDDLLTMAGQRPSLRLMEERIEDNRLELREIRLGALPSLTISGGYGTFRTNSVSLPFRQQLSENRNPSLSFNLTIPLFNRGETLSAVRRSKMEGERLRYNSQMRRQELYGEMQEASIELINCYERYLAARSSLRHFEEAYAVNKSKFDDGTLSGTDFSVARNNLNKAVSDYYQAKFDYLFHTKILDLYMGRPITL